MKTRKTTVTLTFTISQTLQDNDNDLTAVRGLINKIRENVDTCMQVYDREDSNKFEFVAGNSKEEAGRMFTFTTIGEFVRKYAKKGSGDLLLLLGDHGSFVSCKATTVTEKKEPEHAD